ncbi:NAD(P)-dependent oxidoreductase [Saccharopolyspora rosea]|uniref:NAD(P)-dependent oxidoreductase n=1 Tax=Saccharopolyspora rosea TaxID=524884 RepID=A0ABW3G175_9PSEU
MRRAALLEEVFAGNDFVVVQARLTPRTERCITAEHFALMPRHAYFVKRPTRSTRNTPGTRPGARAARPGAVPVLTGHRAPRGCSGLRRRRTRDPRACRSHPREARTRFTRPESTSSE